MISSPDLSKHKIFHQKNANFDIFFTASECSSQIDLITLTLTDTKNKCSYILIKVNSGVGLLYDYIIRGGKVIVIYVELFRKRDQWPLRNEIYERCSINNAIVVTKRTQ